MAVVFFFLWLFPFMAVVFFMAVGLVFGVTWSTWFALV
jgi:hypothetical protein